VYRLTFFFTGRFPQETTPKLNAGKKIHVVVMRMSKAAFGAIFRIGGFLNFDSRSRSFFEAGANLLKGFQAILVLSPDTIF
jgi:hypothetical protein